MMNELLQTRIEKSFSATTGGSNGPVVFTSTGDKLVFTPPAPVRVLKWGFIMSSVALSTGAAGLSMTLEQRPTAGSDTNRVVVDTLAIGINNTSYALGKGAYRESFTASTEVSVPSSMPANSGPLGYTQKIDSGQGQIVCSVGQELVIKVGTAASTTGQGQLFIEYVVLPIARPSGYGTTDAGTVSLTENYTKV